jgi:hypothetical protein
VGRGGDTGDGEEALTKEGLLIALGGIEGHAGDIKGMVRADNGRGGELYVEEDCAQEDVTGVHV